MIESFQTCQDKRYTFARATEVISIVPYYPMVVFVLGGVPPYDWFVTGEAGREPFIFSRNNTKERYNVISTTEFVDVGDSVEEITVTDACGTEAIIWVRCCRERECCKEAAYRFEGQTLNVPFPGLRRFGVAVTGGCAPYTWRVIDNEDFDVLYQTTNLRTNIIVGFTYVTTTLFYSITDRCGNTVIGQINITGLGGCDLFARSDFFGVDNFFC
jgi:hypothetical protein